MKDLGDLSHFLGLEVEPLKDGVFLLQKGYAEKVIYNFGLNQSKWCSTPLNADIKLRHDEGSFFHILRFYQALVSGLICLTIK